MESCKRMKVKAVGFYGFGYEVAENYNENECLNIPGGCGCIHAEKALINKMSYPDLVIVTHSPCFECAVLLVNQGVKDVVYYKEYRLKDGIKYLKDNGVNVISLEG